MGLLSPTCYMLEIDTGVPTLDAAVMSTTIGDSAGQTGRMKSLQFHVHRGIPSSSIFLLSTLPTS